MTELTTAPSKWASRKLWISLAVIALQVALIALYLYVLITAPEKVSTVDGIVAGVAAAAATVVAALYTVTEGKIDLAALPARIEMEADQAKQIAAQLADVTRNIQELSVQVKALSGDPPHFVGG